MNIRTKSDFYDKLDQEYNWRVIELTKFHTTIRNVDDGSRVGLLRAAIPMLYAHWEGYIKISTKYFVDYVNTQKFNHLELSDKLLILSVRSKINKITENGFDSSHEEICNLLRGGLAEQAQINKLLTCFSVESNLSSTVFEKIANSIGINTCQYQSDYPIINSTLLYNRNRIAHGENINIDIEAFETLKKRVLSLLKLYKDDLQKFITMNRHLAVIGMQ